MTKCGVPFNTAWQIAETDPVMALAYWVLFGEFEGGEWDWDALEWKKPQE